MMCENHTTVHGLLIQTLFVCKNVSKVTKYCQMSPVGANFV